ncbi:O-antigen ligase family protein [Bacillaceae bacterium Marseille-Q3522]|nr:O-antigen ligase family protein [Bacillaceae bacterium Marseille-Q3522]
MNKFEKILLSIFFIELFAGGGGRLIDFGVLSIRQVLFLLIIFTFIFRIIKEKAIWNPEVNTFFRFTPLSIGIYLLIGSFAFSAIYGYINGHPLSIIVMDFFRVSFIGLYFPLAYYISNKRFSIERIIKLLKYSALVVAIFTIVVSLLGKTVFSANFYPFYDFINTLMNDDLFFRPSNGVFYKSHVYVLIALIISLNALLNKKFSKIDLANILFCSISILWSESRGLLLAFSFAVLVIILIDGKIIIDPIKGFVKKFQRILKTSPYVKKSAVLILIVLSIPLLYNHMTLERFQDETAEKRPSQTEKDAEADAEVNDISVNARIEFIVDSKRILLENPLNIIIGSGYGTEIAGRTTGIEMSMLDILIEQGVIGLLIWLYLALLAFYYYLAAYKKGASIQSNDIALMAAFAGILLLTNINPYINNPIGICFFLIVLISSYRFKEGAYLNRT